MSTERGEIAAGRGLLECVITGWLGVLGAGVLFAREGYVGAGICLIAAALAFGLRANAVLRH